ncbi:putative late blight resistance protein homolog R1A-10 [Salvia miltiorrhiza]|uniref:putative late blight resistance protein homolog R1A-10 n=1 Tax=Salvia miltiorrhiza TaxID=226208 RepID=UPI0025AC3723|nr:putative late blight resistance protein homolog R1A-10 [Salvia miltiorrhiza]
MAEAVVTILLDNLGSDVTLHVRRISEAKDELQRLENDLRLLNCFLHDVGGNRDLERQIKELAHDIQDIRDSWLIHRAANRHLTPNKIRGMYELAEQISSARVGRIDPLFRRIEAYRDLRELQQHPTKLNQLKKTEEPWIAPNKFVGFEKEEETFISILMEETEEVDVISITGMPGIGKTTLAYKIYHDKRIIDEFPTRIWVDIPLDFNSRDLNHCILIELMRQGMFNMPGQASSSRASPLDILNESIESGRISDHQLIYEVHACLKKRRFLLVMDNVWTADTLQSIRCFLPNAGKILTTSRNNHVAGKPRVLRFLDEDESWKLLQLEVFGNLVECPEWLRPVGKRIVENCDGSPLAISVVASSLMVPPSTDEAMVEPPTDTASALTLKWWEKVAENVTNYITQYCTQHNVIERVEPSYTELPQHLQDCFLYMGVFPQGYDIPVWTLIRLWIAEGLVQDSWGLSLEETAERNLYDLVSRNLVVVGEVKPDGQIKTCRLHIAIYGFCKFRAAEQEFYHEITMSEGVLDSPASLTPNHRRLCIDSCLSEFLSSRPRGPCIRSILCLNNGGKDLSHEDVSTIHKSFKLLKIFECKGAKFTRFPTMLSKLMNLRYISLSCDDVIPKTISSLCYLETLVVHTKSASMIKLEANIWRMPKLRHLVTKAAILLAIKGKGKTGKDLHTLTRFAPVSCTKDVFTRAPNLQRFGIRGHLADLSDADSLKKLERLENLKMVNEPAREIQLDLCCFPPTLKWLTLSGTYLKWASMSTLGKIDSLEILKLKNNAFIGESWSSTAEDGFGRLRFLLIRTTDLVSWEASADCFPSLKQLVLNDCENLQQIPSTPPRNLDKLDVDGTVSESAAEFARKINQARTESNE